MGTGVSCKGPGQGLPCPQTLRSKPREGPEVSLAVKVGGDMSVGQGPPGPVSWHLHTQLTTEGAPGPKSREVLGDQAVVSEGGILGGDISAWASGIWSLPPVSFSNHLQWGLQLPVTGTDVEAGWVLRQHDSWRPAEHPAPPAPLTGAPPWGWEDGRRQGLGEPTGRPRRRGRSRGCELPLDRFQREGERVSPTKPAGSPSSVPSQGPSGWSRTQREGRAGCPRGEPRQPQWREQDSAELGPVQPGVA